MALPLKNKIMSQIDKIKKILKCLGFVEYKPLTPKSIFITQNFKNTFALHKHIFEEDTFVLTVNIGKSSITTFFKNDGEIKEADKIALINFIFECYEE